MLDRAVGFCFTLLAAAIAIYVAARLIESIAATLLLIVAVIGGLATVGFVVRLWWCQRTHRW